MAGNAYFDIANLPEVTELAAKLKLIDSIEFAEGTRTVFGVIPAGKRMDEDGSSFYDLTDDEAKALCNMMRDRVMKRLSELSCFVQRHAVAGEAPGYSVRS